MSRTDANINKETLAFICSQVGVTTVFLSKRTGHPAEKIGAWLDADNDAFPTINQAKNLAKVLKVPFAGLYMNKDILPIKKLPSLRNLRTLAYSCLMDDSALNLAVIELIRYHDFLTSSEKEMDMLATPVSLPTVSDEACVADYAKAIREYFELKLETQFKLDSAHSFIYIFVRKLKAKESSFTASRVSMWKSLAVLPYTMKPLPLSESTTMIDIRQRHFRSYTNWYIS